MGNIDYLIASANGVGVVAHDAGGANILNALVHRFKSINFFLLVEGPAVSIFDASNVTFVTQKSRFYEKIDLVIFGTGNTSFEKIQLRHAKAKNLSSIVVLDHFVNYRKRFVFDGEICFPDYCFVCDEYSLKLAKKELAPYQSVHLCENYLVSRMVSEMSGAKHAKGKSVLYVLENILEDWGDNLIPWQVAFNNFYDNFYRDSDFERIIVRPHPSDAADIYCALDNYEGVIFDYNTSPIDSLSRVTTVIGVESYLLYLSYYCGLSVYTSLPSWIRLPRLPEHSYKSFGN